MSRMVYRFLLRLLPRRRRAAYGDEMRDVFAMTMASSRGRGRRVAALWVREVIGMVKFAWRERFGASGSLGAGPAGRDLRWAWRGVRARGWTAVLSVVLMAVALAAGTLVFASADALIFNRVPYPEADRLVRLQQGVNGRTFDEYRAHTDVFSHAAGRQPSATFLSSDYAPVQVDVEFVTPGLFETLGILPAWGRPLVPADADATDPTAAVIEAGLARERFGSPERAIGRILETSERALTVVGVMPSGFRFPNGRVKIWRALDHQRLNPMFPGMGLIARLAPVVTIETAGATLTARVPHLIPRNATAITVVPQTFGSSAPERNTTLKVLLGAALCLLLAACANVISLELAGAMRRAHVFSVQTALGASRGSLVRVGLLEGAVLVSAAVAAAAALAVAGASAITAVMPEAVVLGGINPIDVDRRALLVLATTAVLVWLVASLPVVLHASRPDVLRVLRADDRGATASRVGLWMRRSITVGQVGLAVVLLVGGLLYLRSYSALLGVDTGLNTAGVYSLGVTSPTRDFSPEAHRDLVSRLADVLGQRADVTSVARIAGSAPPGNAYNVRSTILRDDGESAEEGLGLSIYDVEPSYFPTVGVRPLRGRLLAETDGPDVAVVTDTFALKIWNNLDVIGRTFTFRNLPMTFEVIGVVPHVRTDRDDLGGPSATSFSMFRIPVAQQAPPPASVTVATPPPGPIVNAPSGMLPFRIATLLVRATTTLSTSQLLEVAQSVDTRASYRVRTLDEIYALRHAEARMATSIISSFALTAFAIAIAGVFGVMTFLVTSRTREIGIRMALGADHRDVRRLVLGSSLRLILGGAIVGAAAAVIAGRWIESQLFGVTATDPLTYGAVFVAVLVTAVAATWHPAVRAARIDPAITLRCD